MIATSKGVSTVKVSLLQGRICPKPERVDPLAADHLTYIYLNRKTFKMHWVEERKGKGGGDFSVLDFTISLHPDPPGTSLQPSRSWDNYHCCLHEEAPRKSQLKLQDSIPSVENNPFHMQFGMAVFRKNFLQGGERTHFVGMDLGR